MRYHSLFSLFFLVFSIHLVAQDIHVTDEKSYELFSKQLDSSKELKYQEILQNYDRYIETNPNGLLSGMIFHAINNFIVLVLLYYVSKVWII